MCHGFLSLRKNWLCFAKSLYVSLGLATADELRTFSSSGMSSLRSCRFCSAKSLPAEAYPMLIKIEKPQVSATAAEALRYKKLRGKLGLFCKITTGKCLSNVDQDRNPAGLGNGSRSHALQE